MSPKERGYTTDQIPRQHSDLKQNSNLRGPVILFTALDLLSVLGPDQEAQNFHFASTRVTEVERLSSPDRSTTNQTTHRSDRTLPDSDLKDCIH